MRINSANFVKSVANIKNLIQDKLEICFVGRSNVGKSSLINSLCNQKNLAKTSSTAGRTQLLNYFLINDEIYFVDLPGYGYHKAGKSQESNWIDLINNYFFQSKKIALCCVLLDIRHVPSDKDQQMIAFLNFNKLPYIIIATKCDKLSKTQIDKQKREIATNLKIGLNNIFATSSDKKSGIDEVLTKFDQFILAK